jgi:hypothetical protein
MSYNGATSTWQELEPVRWGENVINRDVPRWSDSVITSGDMACDDVIAPIVSA